MFSEWRRACVGLSSGLFQSPAYLLPQMLAPIGVTVGASDAQLAWLAPLGLLLPVLAGLLAAFGDWFGGRVAILATAALSLAGVGLTTAAGLLARVGLHAAAVGLLLVGGCLVPAAVRQGALVVAHVTERLTPGGQWREACRLRRYLVLGIYVLPLPAGFAAARVGWLWVFGTLAALQLCAVLLLARTLGDEQPSVRPSAREFARGLGASFADRRLLWAAGGAFAAQATVFAFVNGLPLRLAARGCSLGVVGAVTFAAVGAVAFVSWSPARGAASFRRWAGATPVAGVLLLAAFGAMPPAGGGGAWSLAFLAAAAATGVLIELAKQWSQTLALVQARFGTCGDGAYRRQAVVNLGANLGTVAGAGLGQWSARAGQPAWLLTLLAAALVGWVLQASWFATTPRRLRGQHGRSRWRYRGREYLVVTGEYMPGGTLSAIYDAADDHDGIRHERQRGCFDPVVDDAAERIAALGDPRLARARA